MDVWFVVIVGVLELRVLILVLGILGFLVGQSNTLSVVVFCLFPQLELAVYYFISESDDRFRLLLGPYLIILQLYRLCRLRAIYYFLCSTSVVLPLLIVAVFGRLRLFCFFLLSFFIQSETNSIFIGLSSPPLKE